MSALIEKKDEILKSTTLLEMATLFRHSRSIVSRLATAGRTTTFSANGSTIAVQSAAKKSLPADAIRPKPAGDVHYIPLVGRAKTGFGNAVLGLFGALSVYFVYQNFITNPEFYKSLELSRQADKRDAGHSSGGHH